MSLIATLAAKTGRLYGMAKPFILKLGRAALDLLARFMTHSPRNAVEVAIFEATLQKITEMTKKTIVVA